MKYFITLLFVMKMVKDSLHVYWKGIKVCMIKTWAVLFTFQNYLRKKVFVFHLKSLLILLSKY